MFRQYYLLPRLLGLIVASASMLLPAAAQTWPQRSVKLIVTLGPGSGVDIGARLLSDRLSKKWGHPVVIENRPGGDGLVAINAFVAANDDHVLLASPSSVFTAHPLIYKNVPYKPSDLQTIVRVSNTIIAIAVPADLEVKTLGDLVAMTRAQPGKLNWSGTTGAIDFLFAGFLKTAGLNMSKVPYRNPVEAANDLAVGRIHVNETALAIVRPHLQAGKVKMLAVTNSTRAPTYPDIPTVKEAGHADLTLDGLVGFFGPPSMPKELRERIAADVREASNDPLIEERMNQTAQILNIGGPDEFQAAIDDQRARLAIAVKELGIVPME
ncbi:MAG: tripartite tricarboxylate transporter substrate binding protein [Hyphomicrobiales bacterium]|nr:tripartite tricarboxylate transporter substrate binding protein [Hyphomicrobiales bacterium]